MQEEVRNASRALGTSVKQRRAGRQEPDGGLTDPRPK
jgi:hypothetical protein